MPDDVQTVTITGGRPITETYDRERKVKVPAKKPFYSVECDGLPNGIENFAIWPEMDTPPGSFIVGRTYKIGGHVNGKYFNFDDTIIGEVENAKPGVDGVPKDEGFERMKGGIGHDAATITAAIIQAHKMGASDALVSYQMTFEILLAYRLGDNHQAEAKEGPTTNSQPSAVGSGDETTPPGEEYPPR